MIESQSDRLWEIINKQSHTIEDKQQTDIIRIGPNRSKADYIIKRCIAILGKTAQEAMETIVMNSKGSTVVAI